jgi:hypothetical protein
MYDVGEREAARLRVMHAAWLAEAPRKFDSMEVPATALSNEARAAGFFEGSVDGEIVTLAVSKGDDGVEGLLFGSPSKNQSDALKDLGFTFEPTGKPNIWKFKLRVPKRPNQALQHNDPSCHAPCVRTCRASRGRG